MLLSRSLEAEKSNVGKHWTWPTLLWRYTLLDPSAEDLEAGRAFLVVRWPRASRFDVSGKGFAHRAHRSRSRV